MEISQESKDRAQVYMNLKKSVSDRNKIKDKIMSESIKDTEWIEAAHKRRSAGLCQICMTLYIWCQCGKKN